MLHPYNITISPYAVIGKNVNILKGATIGLSQGKKPGAPVIGDSVYIGINSTILGGITIGDDVMIAPNTFINCDIPSHSIVLGGVLRAKLFIERMLQNSMFFIKYRTNLNKSWYKKFEKKSIDEMEK